ncbi:MAG: ABC transporter ATP-binding protein [Ruminococcaceae bacterium]|nr:ABC transporter ATP-binding protein [Oscillospiraceae bacterium]
MSKQKEKSSSLKNTLYALKTVHQCAPLLITSFILVQTAHWFFTGFIQEILFLKLLLQLIEDGGSFEQYAFLVLLFAGAGLLAKGTDCLTDYFVCTRIKHFYKNLNDRIFQKAVKVDMACYENPEFYDKYKRATEIVTNEHFSEFCYNFANVFAGGITGIFLVIYVVSIDPRLLLILLFSIAVVIAGAIKGKLDVKKDKEMTPHKRSKEYVKRTVFLKDFAKDIRTSGIYDVMHNRFKTAVEQNRAIIRRYGVKMMLLELVGGFFGRALPVVSAYGYAAYRFVVKRNLAVSDFSVIMTAVSNLKDVLNDLSEAISCLRKESEYFGNLREFMDYEPKVIGGNKEAEDFESLEFKDVHFTYPGAKKPSLKGLSFRIEKGETIAVVGKNGAGKTTFVKLLLRFYNPDKGVILYNGTDIREYNIDSLRKRLATVFQDYKVFALTVNENVLCRETESGYDLITVDGALKSAGIYERIMSLPEQKETVFTREFDEKGTGLSGGEQQKLCAARMFAKQFDLALLDEPSSALDPIAEYKMYESLIKATKDKTVIYISHRLSSAVLSDKIYVFEGGRVSECGTHEQLMADGKGYCEMFTLQASSYKDTEGSVN